ncbi:MAG: site-specific integrase [Desulfobacterales bacterium]|nr:site-specific integrase [Desulfobacterales bacterium]
MAAKKYKIDSRRWPGVYGYDSLTRKYFGKPDTCYYIAYRANGRLIWEKVGWKSEDYNPAMAAEVRAKRTKSARHGEEVKTQKEIQKEKLLRNRTIGEIKEVYFSSERGKNLKGRKTDLNRYEKHLENLFDKRGVASLSPFDIDRLKRSMKEHAPATVANACELLRRIINFGVKRNLCPRLSFVIELPQKNNAVIEYLNPEEAARLLDVLDNWPDQDPARMLKLAWLTGMRRGEIFKLEDRDCDFQKQIITLRDPKGKRTETIPLSGPVEVLLKEQMKARDKRFPGSPFLFPGLHGKQRKECTAVDRIKTEAALPKKFRIFHGLRHHYAVTLASSGEFTLDMIGSLLTHKSYEMTKRYAAFLPDAKKKAADQAASLLESHRRAGEEENSKKKLAGSGAQL